MAREGLQKACEVGDTKNWVKCLILQTDGTPVQTTFPSKDTLVHLTDEGGLKLYKLGTEYIVPI